MLLAFSLFMFFGALFSVACPKFVGIPMIASLLALSLGGSAALHAVEALYVSLGGHSYISDGSRWGFAVYLSICCWIGAAIMLLV